MKEKEREKRVTSQGKQVLLFVNESLFLSRLFRKQQSIDLIG